MNTDSFPIVNKINCRVLGSIEETTLCLIDASSDQLDKIPKNLIYNKVMDTVLQTVYFSIHRAIETLIEKYDFK